MECSSFSARTANAAQVNPVALPADYYLTTVLGNSQKPVEPLRRNGSTGSSNSSEICAGPLKVLQSQGFPFVCLKTPTLKAAGSTPVGRTRNGG